MPTSIALKTLNLLFAVRACFNRVGFGVDWAKFNLEAN